MPFDLLLFPLSGGYYIFMRFHYTRFLQQRLDRQRLLFNSIITGVILVILTYFLRIIVESIYPPIVSVLYSALPFHTPYFGTASFSLFFALFITELSNRIFKKKKAIEFAISLIGNEFELLLKSSIEYNRLLQITLDNDKFYIGWAKELPIPSESNYVRITPAFSGYRNEKKNLVFTTQYLTVYSSYVEEGKIKSIYELNSDIVIKTDNILSANFFDGSMYEKFNRIP